MQPAHANYGRTAPQVKKPRRGFLLPLMTVLTLGSAMATWQYAGSTFAFGVLKLQSDKPNSGGGAHIDPRDDNRVNRRFQMHGVRLGMTPDMIQALHPQATADRAPSGDDVVTVATKRGALVAWMVEEPHKVEYDDSTVVETAQRIWRMRMDEGFVSLSEEQLLNHYREAYGLPLSGNCQRTQAGDSPQCHFRWWGGDGIHLEAISRVKIAPNGQVYTLLTTIATDSYAQSKIRDKNRITPKLTQARARPAAPYGRYGLSSLGNTAN